MIGWSFTSFYYELFYSIRKRLYLLYEQANAIFLEILEVYAGSNMTLPRETGQSVRAIESALGTFLAPFPFSQAFTVGIIGAVATFVFGALKIPGPAAIFFVLAFTMTSAMPINPEIALERGGFVLLGGNFWGKHR